MDFIVEAVAVLMFGLIFLLIKKIVNRIEADTFILKDQNDRLTLIQNQINRIINQQGNK